MRLSVFYYHCFLLLIRYRQVVTKCVSCGCDHSNSCDCMNVCIPAVLYDWLLDIIQFLPLLSCICWRSSVRHWQLMLINWCDIRPSTWKTVLSVRISRHFYCLSTYCLNMSVSLSLTLPSRAVAHTITWLYWNLIYYIFICTCIYCI